MRETLMLIGLLLAGSLLVGCSWLGLGHNDYSCTGRPDGVRCRSARDVYHATHGGQVPAPTSTDRKTPGEKLFRNTFIRGYETTCTDTLSRSGSADLIGATAHAVQGHAHLDRTLGGSPR